MKWILIAGSSTRDIKRKVTSSSDSTNSFKAKTFGKNNDSLTIGAYFNKFIFFYLFKEGFFGILIDV